MQIHSFLKLFNRFYENRMTEKNPAPLDTEVLKHVFTHNLNRIYFGKCYLDKHLEHLISIASFPALQMAMEEFWGDIKHQITRMDEIYARIGETPSDKNCNPIKSIVNSIPLIVVWFWVLLWCFMLSNKT